MNSRERLLSAVNHKESDKIPLDFGVTTVTGIGIQAYEELLALIGEPADDQHQISHIHQGLVYPREDIYQRFGVDSRPLFMPGAPRGTVAEWIDDSAFYDEYHIRWSKGVFDYAPVSEPYPDLEVEDINGIILPDPYDPSRVAGMKQRAQDLFKNTDYALVADIITRGPFESAVKLRGYEAFLMDFYLEPLLAEKLLEKITDNILMLWDVYLNEIGEYAQVVCQGDDLGSQSALIMGDEIYRKFIKPCHKRIYDFIHSKTNAKVFMHSCGAIFDIIPDLIEVGVDILNPIQKGAANMGLEKLKKKFGNDICFWGGGIDVQLTLPEATETEIEEEVKRSIDIMGQDGGYVFAATHNIHADVPARNIAAMLEAVQKYR